MGMSSMSYFFGTAGAAVPVPIIGAVSRSLAEKLTLNNARFADQVIRAGKNARKITAAYLDNTAPKARSAEELSQLLIRQDIDLNKLPKNKFNNEARKSALMYREKLKNLTAAAAAGAAKPEAKIPPTEEEAKGQMLETVDQYEDLPEVKND